MSGLPGGFDAARAAQILVRDQFCVRPGETVIVTADTASDRTALEAILAAAAAAGGQSMLILIPQLREGKHGRSRKTSHCRGFSRGAFACERSIRFRIANFPGLAS